MFEPDGTRQRLPGSHRIDCSQACEVVPAAVTTLVVHGVALWNPSCTSGVLGQVRVPSDHGTTAILLRQPRR